MKKTDKPVGRFFKGWHFTWEIIKDGEGLKDMVVRVWENLLPFYWGMYPAWAWFVPNSIEEIEKLVVWQGVN